MNKELVFNIFANTGSCEAYLLYKELNQLEHTKEIQAVAVNSQIKQQYEI